MCPHWAESPAAPGGAKLRTRQFQRTMEGGKKMSGKVSVALVKCMSHSQSVCRTLLPHSHACFFGIFPLFFLCPLPRFSTYSRSCNGHAPLLIQKGRTQAGQKVQPRRVGQNSAPDSSTALGEGKRMDESAKWQSVCRTLSSQMFFANVLHKVITYSHTYSRTYSSLCCNSLSLRSLLHDGMFIASFSEPLNSSQFSFCSRKKEKEKGRKKIRTR
jgi:hypothetical protein